MPYHKRKRRVTRKPRYKRYKQPTTLGLPTSNFARLRYTEAVTLDVGAGGTISKYVFSANDLFDPNVTASGHQPMTFDQLSTFYNHYVVSGAKITVQAYDYSDATIKPNLIGIMLNDDTVTPSLFNEVIEQRKCKYKICAPQQKSVTVTSNYSAKKFFNITDIKDNLDRIGASVAGSPADRAFFTIFALPIDVSTDTPSFSCVVTIDYIAHFSEPKDIAQS